MTSAINRYYDPSTDQFLSIDPAVAATNEPYLFTNDDPLNAEDPLGQKISTGQAETNAENAAIAKEEAKAKAEAEATAKQAEIAALERRAIGKLPKPPAPQTGNTTEVPYEQASSESYSSEVQNIDSAATQYVDSQAATSNPVAVDTAPVNSLCSGLEGGYGLIVTGGSSELIGEGIVGLPESEGGSAVLIVIGAFGAAVGGSGMAGAFGSGPIACPRGG